MNGGKQNHHRGSGKQAQEWFRSLKSWKIVVALKQLQRFNAGHLIGTKKKKKASWRNILIKSRLKGKIHMGTQELNIRMKVNYTHLDVSFKRWT